MCTRSYVSLHAGVCFTLYRQVLRNGVKVAGQRISALTTTLSESETVAESMAALIASPAFRPQNKMREEDSTYIRGPQRLLDGILPPVL